MIGTIIVVLVLLLLSWIVNGFNIIAITALIATLLFCARKVGYYCRFNTLIVVEVIGIALTVVLKILFGSFVFLEILPVLVLRCAFIGVCYYEVTQYVYVKERRRKEK